MGQKIKHREIYQFQYNGESFALNVSSSKAFALDELNSTIISLSNQYSRVQISEILKGQYPENEINQRLDYIFEGYDEDNDNSEIGSYLCYTLVLHPSRRCNLSCKYCFGTSPNIIKKEIDFNTAKKAIDCFINQLAPDGKKYILDLSGSGEPLISFDLVKDIYNYCQEIREKLDRDILVTFVTNGTLLKKEQIDFLMSTDILFGVSLDGPAEINDDLRIFRDGRGTYKTIIGNCIQIEGYDHLGFAVTLTGKHPNVKEIFLTLYDLKMADAISIRPVRYDNGNYSINKNNIREMKENYDTFMEFLLEQTLAGNTGYLYTILNGEDFLGKFLKIIFCQDILSTRCDAGKSRFSVNYNGDIYVCPVLLDNPKFKIGNIDTGINKKNKENLLKA